MTPSDIFILTQIIFWIGWATGYWARWYATRHEQKDRTNG